MTGRNAPPADTEAPRVLMFGPSLNQHGGIATVLRTWCEYWDRSRFQLRTITTYDSHLGPLHRKLRILPAALTQTVRELVFRRPDIAHVHFSWRGSLFRKGLFLLLLICFRVRPIVLQCHAGGFPDSYRSGNRLFKAYVRWFLNRADLLLVVSQRLHDELSPMFSETPIETLYNVVADRRREAEEESGSRTSTRGNGGIVAVTLGDVTADKGSYDLVAAAKLTTQQGVDIEYYLGGNGDLEGVRSAAAEVGLAGRFHLLGWIEGSEKESLLRDADVFVLPSRAEGMPASVIEAMVREIPVVSTRVGGIPELVTDGRTGLLVAAEDPRALSKALATLARNPGLRRRMGREGRHRIMAICAPEVSLSRLYGLYERQLCETGAS